MTVTSLLAAASRCGKVMARIRTFSSAGAAAPMHKTYEKPVQMALSDGIVLQQLRGPAAGVAECAGGCEWIVVEFAGRGWDHAGGAEIAAGATAGPGAHGLGAAGGGGDTALPG